MDEQQLRSAVVTAIQERIAQLRMDEAGLERRRLDVVMTLEQVSGDLRETQGRIAESMFMIEMMQTGQWREVEVPDEPEEV